jgi:hypothetical protein
MVSEGWDVVMAENFRWQYGLVPWCVCQFRHFRPVAYS